jgi:hypothetical protein
MRLTQYLLSVRSVPGAGAEAAHLITAPGKQQRGPGVGRSEAFWELKG